MRHDGSRITFPVAVMVSLGMLAPALPVSSFLTHSRPLSFSRPAHQLDDKTSVLRTVERLFEAMKANDTAGMRAVLHPTARIIQTGTREGAPFVRVNSADEFLKAIGAAGGGLEERIQEPEVRIDDNLATVWTRYTFFRNGSPSHCGVDSYQVVRLPEGWRILQVVDTQRRAGCQ